MTENQKRLKNRMESEGAGKTMTRAEWDRLMGGNKTKTGRPSKAGTGNAKKK